MHLNEVSVYQKCCELMKLSYKSERSGFFETQCSTCNSAVSVEWPLRYGDCQQTEDVKSSPIREDGA